MHKQNSDRSNTVGAALEHHRISTPHISNLEDNNVAGGARTIDQDHDMICYYGVESHIQHVYSRRVVAERGGSRTVQLSDVITVALGVVTTPFSFIHLVLPPPLNVSRCFIFFRFLNSEISDLVVEGMGYYNLLELESNFVSICFQDYYIIRSNKFK